MHFSSPTNGNKNPKKSSLATESPADLPTKKIKVSSQLPPHPPTCPTPSEIPKLANPSSFLAMKSSSPNQRTTQTPPPLRRLSHCPSPPPMPRNFSTDDPSQPPLLKPNSRNKTFTTEYESHPGELAGRNYSHSSRGGARAVWKGERGCLGGWRAFSEGLLSPTGPDRPSRLTTSSAVFAIALLASLEEGMVRARPRDCSVTRKRRMRTARTSFLWHMEMEGEGAKPE